MAEQARPKTTEELMLALLKNVGDPGQCRGCQSPIFWVTHRNGKKAPYTPAGLNHFADCPAAGDFRTSARGGLIDGS